MLHLSKQPPLDVVLGTEPFEARTTPSKTCNFKNRFFNVKKKPLAMNNVCSSVEFCELVWCYKLNVEKVQVERQFSERCSAVLINVEKVEPR